MCTGGTQRIKEDWKRNVHARSTVNKIYFIYFAFSYAGRANKTDITVYCISVIDGPRYGRYSFI